MSSCISKYAQNSLIWPGLYICITDINSYRGMIHVVAQLWINHTLCLSNKGTHPKAHSSTNYSREQQLNNQISKGSQIKQQYSINYSREQIWNNNIQSIIHGGATMKQSNWVRVMHCWCQNQEEIRCKCPKICGKYCYKNRNQKLK